MIRDSGAAEGVPGLDSGVGLVVVLKLGLVPDGGAKKKRLSCERVKNRYIIQGFAQRMFGVVVGC